MTTYQEIRRQVGNLSQEEQLELIEKLAIVVRRQKSSKPKHSVMELAG